MKTPFDYFYDNVWPHVPQALKDDVLSGYPDVRLGRADGFAPLANCNIVMIVGLTGTGKSTMLKALDASGALDYRRDVPSRRELADLILIPGGQYVSELPIGMVKDRTRRFTMTRIFREEIADGGTAAAFSWLSYRDPDALVLSEGVRGANEIDYAMHDTRWRIVELWVDPITRLRRLSDRKSDFDTVKHADVADLSFLDDEQRKKVRALLEKGEITPSAVTTARAEAVNYGNKPYDKTNTTPNYRCIPVDGLTPEDVAHEVAQSIRLMQ